MGLVNEVKTSDLVKKYTTERLKAAITSGSINDAA